MEKILLGIVVSALLSHAVTIVQALLNFIYVSCKCKLTRLSLCLSST